MSSNSIKCQYYCDGMCFYTNGKFAIYEKCYKRRIPEDIQDKFVKNCATKKTIKIIESSSERTKKGKLEKKLTR